MQARWGLAVASAMILTGCSQPTSSGPGDVLVGDGDPTGGAFGQQLGPRVSSSIQPVPGAGISTAPEHEPRGTDAWRIIRPAAGRIAAYTTRTSAPPGARVGLKVSTRAKRYRVSAYRLGVYPGGTGALIWRSRFLAGQEQPAPVLSPVETRTVVAPWRRSLTFDTTGWEPGFYVLELRTWLGWETAVPYVVSSLSAVGSVALVAPVTTWQAYNAWGGYSLYAGPAGDRRSWAVSYDRPYNLMTGANDYRTAAIPVILRAERLHHRRGIPLSYFTNVDLTSTPARSTAPTATSRWATMSTGRLPCARRSRLPAAAAQTWLSSAPTPCTGGSGSRTGPPAPPDSRSDTAPTRSWTRCARPGQPRRPHGSATSLPRNPSRR